MSLCALRFFFVPRAYTTRVALFTRVHKLLSSIATFQKNADFSTHASLKVARPELERASADENNDRAFNPKKHWLLGTCGLEKRRRLRAG